MRITSAAIKYRTKDDPENDKFVTGSDHSYCYDCFSCMDLNSEMRLGEYEEEGYLTDEGTFVNRRVAYDIAKQANQIKYPNEVGILYSYNLSI